MSALGKRLTVEILKIPGVSENPSQFSPLPAWWVDGKEIAHLHGGELIDIRLTKKEISARRSQLRNDDRVSLGRNDWITFKMLSQEDLSFVLGLMKVAARANRRKPGERSRPMPDDKMLARRRAFHRARTDDLG